MKVLTYSVLVGQNGSLTTMHWHMKNNLNCKLLATDRNIDSDSPIRLLWLWYGWHRVTEYLKCCFVCKFLMTTVYSETNLIDSPYAIACCLTVLYMVSSVYCSTYETLSTSGKYNAQCWLMLWQMLFLWHGLFSLLYQVSNDIAWGQNQIHGFETYWIVQSCMLYRHRRHCVNNVNW